MKVIYDRDADVLLLVLKEASVEESDEVRDGVILDYDSQGDIVAVEILDASRRIAQPEGIEFQLAK
jgi:uncharacterized protein YuzE